MRILFATNHAYPPYRVGGSESSTHDLCLTLAELGAEVAVLSSSLPRRSTGRLDRVRPFPRRPSAVARDDLPGYSVFRAPSPALAAPAVVAAFRPDVAVVQAGRPLALSLALSRVGVPALVYLRDAGFAKLGGDVRRHPPAQFAATSSDLARRFQDQFGIAAAVIPPVVRPDRYSVRTARRSVVFVCPVRGKGVEIALALARERPDIPFDFVESWELNPVHRVALRRRLDLPNVKLHRPEADARAFYSRARVVLVPSRWPEGWGRVVSEAQVSGIPALATDLGGLPEAVGPCGVLVAGGADAAEWAAALARVWDDEREYERLVACAYEHARRPEFEPHSLAGALLSLLGDAL
jgi:glycosyltransferase involved in cell wall biosynthesis